MSNLKEIFTLSIDLNKIDKSKIKEVTRKDGTLAKFLDLTLYVNDEADSYNQIGSVSLGQSKEEREAQKPKVYIGNAKRQWAANGGSTQPLPRQNNGMGLTEEEENSLPF